MAGFIDKGETETSVKFYDEIIYKCLCRLFDYEPNLIFISVKPTT